MGFHTASVYFFKPHQNSYESYYRYDRVNNQKYDAYCRLEALAEGRELKAVLDEDQTAKRDIQVAFKHCNNPAIPKHVSA